MLIEAWLSVVFSLREGFVLSHDFFFYALRCGFVLSILSGVLFLFLLKRNVSLFIGFVSALLFGSISALGLYIYLLCGVL